MRRDWACTMKAHAIGVSFVKKILTLVILAWGFGAHGDGQPQADLIVLRARDATIIGDAKLAGDKIGSWNSVAAHVVWTTTVARAGTYRVLFEYSCTQQASGTEFDVLVGSQRANGVVADTGGWGSFTNLDLGPVLVRKAGLLQIEVVPTKSRQKSSLMNLRSVTLRRED